MAQFEFEYETTEGMTLQVTVDIHRGSSQTYPDLHGPGEPAEDPTIDILRVEVKDTTFIEDDLIEAAWTAWEGEQ